MKKALQTLWRVDFPGTCKRVYYIGWSWYYWLTLRYKLWQAGVRVVSLEVSVEPRDPNEPMYHRLTVTKLDVKP